MLLVLTAAAALVPGGHPPAATHQQRAGCDRRQALGLALSLADFFHDVFKDPMPPTRAEQAALRSSRKRRAVVYGWLLLAVLVWGALGTLWVRTSTQCARTAPQLYRLALLTLIAYAALVTVICVVIVMLALDFCCSGRLRMVVVFEQK